MIQYIEYDNLCIHKLDYNMKRDTGEQTTDKRQIGEILDKRQTVDKTQTTTTLTEKETKTQIEAIIETQTAKTEAVIETQTATQTEKETEALTEAAIETQTTATIETQTEAIIETQTATQTEKETETQTEAAIETQTKAAIAIAITIETQTEKETRQTETTIETQTTATIAIETQTVAAIETQTAAAIETQTAAAIAIAIETQTAAAIAIAIETQTAAAIAIETQTETEINKKFYLTTAINYTNGPPHIGHAYEAIGADVIARFQRSFGKDVFFLTGTDEHGQKIADTAANIGLTPIALCNKNVQLFKDLNTRLLISNDGFIRTTSQLHKEIAQEVWTAAEKAGDIYLGIYSGWYNVREERFVSESEAKMDNYLDKVSGKVLTRHEEPSYFFRLSKYRTQIIDWIRTHPNFIAPESRKSDILGRLENEALIDLSISRTSFNWGVPIPLSISVPISPNDSDIDSKTDTDSDSDSDSDSDLKRISARKSHIMYVWFDALTNYLSGINHHIKLSPTTSTEKGQSEHWPADVHIIGQDIVWFHSVIWSAMLMSIGYPLPKTIFSHGFVVAEDGTKMSKSLGNTVDPNDVIDKYGAEAFRWYLMRETKFGDMLAFSPKGVTTRFNQELADEFLNLVNRSVSLGTKHNNNMIPDLDPTIYKLCNNIIGYPFDVQKLYEQVVTAINNMDTHIASEVIMQITRQTNKWINDLKPWSKEFDPFLFIKEINKNIDTNIDIEAIETAETFKIIKTQIFEHIRKWICAILIEASYILAHYYQPFIPNISSRIFGMYEEGPRPLANLHWNMLIVGTEIVPIKEALFKKFQYCHACNEIIDIITNIDNIKFVNKSKKRYAYHMTC